MIKIFGSVLLFFYNICNSYGGAILLFGLLVKLIMLPFQMKSKHSMMRTTMLTPRVKELEKKKPVIFCGDLNVAHQEIDLKNPSSNHHNAGFTDEERGKMTALLSSGFTDTWRHFHPDTAGVYSWWSYRFRAREKNAGWRIDYFIVSDVLVPQLQDAMIYTDVFGSDHCPVGIVINQ